MPGEEDVKTGTGNEGSQTGGTGQTNTPPADNTDWKAKATSQEAELNDLRGRFTALEGKYNESTNAIKDLKKKHKGNSPEDKDDYEATVRNEYEGKYSGQIAELNDKLSAKDTLIRKLTITNTAKSHAAQFFRPDMVDLMVNEIEKHCDLDGENVVIKDGSGTTRMSQQRQGQKMTLEELCAELATKYESARSPSMKSGTGHNVERSGGSNGASGNVSLPPNFQNWNTKEQTKFFADNPDARRAFLRSNREGGS